MFQENFHKEAAGGRGWTSYTEWSGRVCSASSSCLLSSCALLGKAVWEIWQVFLSRLGAPVQVGLEITSLSPCALLRKVKLTSHSLCLWIWCWDLNACLGGEAKWAGHLAKGTEKKKNQPGSLASSYITSRSVWGQAGIFKQQRSSSYSCNFFMIKNQIAPVGIKKLNQPVPFIRIRAVQGRGCVGVHILQNTPKSFPPSTSCFQSHDPTALQADRLVMPGAVEQSWVKDQLDNMDITNPWKNSSAVKNVGALAGSKMDVRQQGSFEAMKTILSQTTAGQGWDFCAPVSTLCHSWNDCLVLVPSAFQETMKNWIGSSEGQPG